jgi:colicin import membrane protein
MSDVQELITIDAKDALGVFASDDPATTFAPILAPVRRAIDAFVADISTAKGRKEVASFARRVVDSKTMLEEIGKGLADEVKKQPKLIDASRRYIKDTLDNWRDEARKPLTDWENAEEARIKRHTEAVAYLTGIASPSSGVFADELRQLISEAEVIDVNPEACDEFESEYAYAKKNALIGLKAALISREKRDADEEELAKLRKEAAERAAKDRDAEIARNAAAEATARAEKVAEQERWEASAREQKIKDDADTVARLAAETVARIKQDVDDERVRVETAARQLREADEKRAADREHCAKINRAALASFVANGFDEAQGRCILELIVKHKIPNVTINY